MGPAPGKGRQRHVIPLRTLQQAAPRAECILRTPEYWVRCLDRFDASPYGRMDGVLRLVGVQDPGGAGSPSVS